MTKRGILHALSVFVLTIFVLLLLFAGIVMPDSGLAVGAVGNWEEVGSSSATGGGISNNSGESGWPDIVANDSGEIFVAWYDKSAGDSEIYVRRWTGSQWAEVGAGSAAGGGISNNSGESKAVSLAIKADGRPCAAWRDWSSGSAEIYVRCWNGSQWAEVGSGSASGGGISSQGDSSTSRRWPSLVIADNGSMYVAWENSDGSDTEIFAAMWDGSAWKRLGPNNGNVSNNSGDSWLPALALAPDGNPYVAWQDESGSSSEIYVRRWTGSSWAEVSSGSAGGGGISNSSGQSNRAAITIDGGGWPVISWADDTAGDEEIYVRQWNGSSWVEVGGGSAAGGGISSNAGDSKHGRIAGSPSGQPCITWYDNTPGQNEIYARCWSGTTWEELGSGSATNGGISKNNGESSLPAITFDGYGKSYVTWGDNSSGNYEIYIRRYDAPAEQTPTATSIPPSNTPSAWNFLPVVNGINPGPTLTPSITPTATSTPTPTNTPEPGRLASPTLYDIINDDGDGSFTVGWSTAPDAEFYRLEQRKGSGNWQQVYEGPLLSFNRSNLSDGQYCYRVRALNSVTDSDWSAIKCTNVVSATSTPTATNTPVPPKCSFEIVGDAWPGMSDHQMTYLKQKNIVVITGGENYEFDGKQTSYQILDEIYVYDVLEKELYFAGELTIPRRSFIAIPLDDYRILLTGGWNDTNWDDLDDEIVHIEKTSQGYDAYSVTRKPVFTNAVGMSIIDDHTILVVSYYQNNTYDYFNAETFDVVNGEKEWIVTWESNLGPILDIKQMEEGSNKFLLTAFSGGLIIDIESKVVTSFTYPPVSAIGYDPENYQGIYPGILTPLSENEMLFTNGLFGERRYRPTNKTFMIDSGGSYRMVGDTNHALDGRVALLLNGGYVVLIGGSQIFDEDGPYTSSEVFNPLSETFYIIDGPESPRDSGKSVKLEEGVFLISGGFDDHYMYDGREDVGLTTEVVELVTCK